MTAPEYQRGKITCGEASLFGGLGHESLAVAAVVELPDRVQMPQKAEAHQFRRREAGSGWHGLLWALGLAPLGHVLILQHDGCPRQVHSSYPEVSAGGRQP